MIEGRAYRDVLLEALATYAMGVLARPAVAFVDAVKADEAATGAVLFSRPLLGPRGYHACNVCAGVKLHSRAWYCVSGVAG
jgi:hypothetical protein